jgi:hypothetical protein
MYISRFFGFRNMTEKRMFSKLPIKHTAPNVAWLCLYLCVFTLLLNQLTELLSKLFNDAVSDTWLGMIEGKYI